jgi:hypothetical protein
MRNELLDREAAAAVVQLPAGPRVVIIGSTSLWSAESPATCGAVGRLLAGIEGLILLTGGVEGAGEAVGRSFFGARPGSDGHRGLFHVLPHGYWRWDYGEILFAGSGMEERREVLARLAACYVVIEGGPGTAHESSVALARSACVIPVGRSGGYAGELYNQLSRPPIATNSAWGNLARADASSDQGAEAVAAIVSAHVRDCCRGVQQVREPDGPCRKGADDRRPDLER